MFILFPVGVVAGVVVVVVVVGVVLFAVAAPATLGGVVGATVVVGGVVVACIVAVEVGVDVVLFALANAIFAKCDKGAIPGGGSKFTVVAGFIVWVLVLFVLVALILAREGVVGIAIEAVGVERVSGGKSD